MCATIFNKHLHIGKSPLLLMTLIPYMAEAKCGGVNYSWGAGALAKAHDYTVTMMLYIQYIIFAVGAIVSVIGVLLIFFKMNNGDNDITKSIMMLIGGILFLLGASVVFPALFGYDII